MKLFYKNESYTGRPEATELITFCFRFVAAILKILLLILEKYTKEGRCTLHLSELCSPVSLKVDAFCQTFAFSVNFYKQVNYKRRLRQ